MHHFTGGDGSAHYHHCHRIGAAGRDHHQVLKGTRTCLHRDDERKTNPPASILPNNGAVILAGGFGSIKWNCYRSHRCRGMEGDRRSVLGYGALPPQRAIRLHRAVDKTPFARQIRRSRLRLADCKDCVQANREQHADHVKSFGVHGGSILSFHVLFFYTPINLAGSVFEKDVKHEECRSASSPPRCRTFSKALQFPLQVSPGFPPC